ncbi:NAD(P)-dependent oxidoreductase [Novosphingobium sp.]|uniref:NAD-dependent epimerase/dehydratase family protein n=1 Tax=Novosphingobium sp. TaxID=1874826 RepID=UPI0025CE8C87|nr:NAD(P)-dependent oxidoreductase [Novosphingobium sp.]
MKIAVTGSSGKLGCVAMRVLKAAGHRVTGFDLSASTYGDATVRLDCSDFGAVMGALSGVDAAARGFDAVLHLAGIPMPGTTTDEAAFRVNTMSTYNVFSAAARLGINKVVWASSETILGLPFAEPPEFAPVTEAHPLKPNWSYALSKVLGEEMAGQFARWHPQMAITSLRFSNVYSAEDYAAIPTIQADPASRKWNLWGYVDAEDAADACRLALEATHTGHRALIIAAADNVAGQDSRALMAEHFPTVPLADDLTGDASLLSSAAAREAIGYAPSRSWRNRCGAAQAT